MRWPRWSRRAGAILKSRASQIDAYLAAPLLAPPTRPVRQGRGGDALLELAILIKDQSRTEKARLALIDMHREAVTSRSQWWHTFDALIDNKRARIPKAELDELVKSLEDLLTELADGSDPSKFNPHDAESALFPSTAVQGRETTSSACTLVGRTF